MNEKRFGLLRSIFWPVYRSEVKKVLSMVLLLFLLCISYNILRNLKDTIILTAKHSGAEVIPFIKVWGMLPAAFMAAWLFTRLRRYFRKENVFYILLSCYIVYLLFFAFFLFPYSDALHLDRLGDWLSSYLPLGFAGFIALIRNWTFTSFYIISELWSVLVLFLLYWGFANDVTGVGEAKRTYGILNIGSNLAPIVGGYLAMLFTWSGQGDLLSIAMQKVAWENTIIQLLSLVSFLAVCCMALFYWINRRIIVSEATPQEQTPETEETAKNRLSIRASIRYISRSSYLIPLAIIVLGYNISINITDVLWKEQLRRYFVNPAEMLEHMNLITIGIGIFATVGGIFFSLMVTRLGWTFIAMLTPFIMTTMAIGFFTFLFFGDALGSLSAMLFGVTPMAMTVYFGSLQNCLSKGCKYSLFDASKELSFLTLNPESKLKGKAAIDGLGSGLGKSGSSLAYQFFIVAFGSVALSTPCIAITLFIVLIAWILSVFALGKQFSQLTGAAKDSVENPLPDSKLSQ
ncbi:MAG TPA: Npt1/Npt2 family nucleotide transporter [Rhabdochlamydiaceae bacterium]|jgi:AAA family ATP:ADP antiporter